MFILHVLVAIYVLLLARTSVSSPLIATEYAVSEKLKVTADETSTVEGPQGDSGAATIICTVDGNIHGLDSYGRTVWMRSSGGAMVAAQNYERQSPHALSRGPTAQGKRNYAVLPAIDGSLIYSSLDGLRKTGITARMLAEQAPFVSQDGVSFTGSTRTRILSLDARSGRVLFDSEGKAQTGPPAEGALPVWFGRVDYFVRAVDTLTGREEFNLSYSVLQPVPYSPSYGAGALAGVPAVSTAAIGAVGDKDDEASDSALSMIAAEGSRLLGLLGDRSTASASAEESEGEGDSDESHIGDVASADLPSQSVACSTDREGTLPRAPRTKRPRRRKEARTGGGASGGGRRKRKDRMRMEQRAGEAQALRERVLRAAADSAEDASDTALSPLDPDAMAVISTPDGELYFSDLDGTVVERVPVSLKSPVMQAFHLRRVPGSAAADDARAAASWDIRSINVHHRIVTRRGGPAHALISDAGGRNSGAIASAHPASGGETTVVVQSPQGIAARHEAGGALFALEVRELEMPPLEDVYHYDRERPPVRQPQALLAGTAPVPMLSAPERSMDTVDRTGNAPSESAAGRSKAHFQVREPPELAFAGLGKSKNKRKRQKTDQAAPILHSELALCGQQQSLSAAGDAFAVSTDGQPSGPECMQGEPLEGQRAAWEPVGSEPAVRGRHVLRADLYDGVLFRPDEAMQLFRGMLSPAMDRADISRASASAEPAPKPSSQPTELPLPATYDPRVASAWRLAEFLLRANGAATYALSALLFVVATAMLFLLALILFPTKEGVLAEASGWLRQALLARLQGPTTLTESVPARESVPKLDRRRTRKLGVVRDSTAEDKARENGAATDRERDTKQAVAAAVPTVLSPPGVAAVVEGVDAQGRRTLQVGSLLVLPDHVLGYGSHGTVVYRGSLHGRPLAVKRVLSQFVKAAEREISLLIRSDGHPNVVRYFTKEEHSDFVYLGLQLCEMTLKDYVVRASERALSAPGNQPFATTGPLAVPDDVRDSLLQITRGLAHLHANKIVHRDLKPHNILCFAPDSTAGAAAAGEGVQQPDGLGAFVLKISDMGLSKQLDREHHSFSSLSLSVSLAGREAQAGRLGSAGAHADHPIAAAAAAAAVGTVGWQAPELIRHRYDGGNQGTRGFSSPAAHGDPGAAVGEGLEIPEHSSSGLSEKLRDPLAAAKLQRKRTLTVDVFSLGCVFYFTITLGSHPFGQWYEREANIAAGRADLSLVRNDPAALDLIAWMLHPDPHLRPSSKGVCMHAFFWPAPRRLDFLMEFSDRLEQEPADAAVVRALETGTHVIHDGRWDAALDALLLADLSRFRKYDCTSIRDLLRVIRNKRHHFYELPPELRAAMGALPADFLRYFESRFPQLLLHCATVAGSFLQTETPFACCAGSTSPPRSRRAESQPPQRLSSEATTPANNADCTPTSAYKNLPDIAAQKEAVWASARRAASWWPSADSWAAGAGGERKRAVASHLAKATEDVKYRTRLCSQWEESGGAACAMRKKGKCVFAHGPLELRAKDSRRGKWGRPLPANAATLAAWECSGGENVLGDARMLAQGRSAMVASGMASAERGPAFADAEQSLSAPAQGDAFMWQQHISQLQHQHQHQQQLYHQQQMYHQFYQPQAPLLLQQVPMQMQMEATGALPWSAAAPHAAPPPPPPQQQHPQADQQSLTDAEVLDRRRNQWESAQGYPAHSQSPSYYR